jgi:hypothetical protein
MEPDDLLLCNAQSNPYRNGMNIQGDASTQESWRRETAFFGVIA